VDSSLDVLILRDPRESPKRCSLTPLRGLAGLRFCSWSPTLELEVGGRLLLHPEGALLQPGEGGEGLLLLDCSWRRLERLLACLRGETVRRRLPPLRTAYPRRSRTFTDPAQGLASVEALYAATAVLGRPRPELLRGYRWAEDFLAANPGLRSGALRRLESPWK
jgi:pre-rRNA-processing protein TSR3